MNPEDQQPVVLKKRSFFERSYESRTEGNILKYILLFLYSFLLLPSIRIFTQYLQPEIRYGLYEFNALTYFERLSVSEWVLFCVVSGGAIFAVYKIKSTALKISGAVFILYNLYIVVAMVFKNGVNGIAYSILPTIFSFIFLALALLLGTVFGLLIKSILKINSAIYKGILLGIPYVLFFSFFIFIYTQTKNINIDMCNKIVDQFTSEICYASIAKKTNNLDLCIKADSHEVTKGYFYREDMNSGGFLCVKTISNNLEKESKFSSSDCANFSEVASRDFCYNKNAISRKDVSLCDGILNQEVKNSCVTKLAWLVPVDISICKKMVASSDGSGYERRKCIARVALEKIDPVLCEEFQLSEIGEKERCLTDTYTKLASVKNDILICKQVSVPRDQIFCVTSFAEERNDFGICDSLDELAKSVKVFGANSSAPQSSYYGYVELCYSHIAEKTKDLLVCEKLKEPLIKESCMSNIKKEEEYNLKTKVEN